MVNFDYFFYTKLVYFKFINGIEHHTYSNMRSLELSKYCFSFNKKNESWFYYSNNLILCGVHHHIIFKYKSDGSPHSIHIERSPHYTDVYMIKI